MKVDLKALYACKQENDRYRKEIENTGVFVSGIWEMLEYAAMQPNGQWQAFDYEPILTESGWSYVGDSPDDLYVEGDLNVHWSKTLCKHERYEIKLSRIRKVLQ